MVIYFQGLGNAKVQCVGIHCALAFFLAEGEEIMNGYYDLTVCGLSRKLPFVDMADGMAYASFVVISDTELIEKAGEELARKANGADIVLTIEAKGIALAYEISRQLHMKEFVVVRKSVKPYVKAYLKDSVHSITTEGEDQIFLDEADSDRLKGKNACHCGRCDIQGRVFGGGRAAGGGSRGRNLCKAGYTGRGRRGRERGYYLSGKAALVSEGRRRL